ncbi:MAG: hypothetical protein JSU86_12050, partial [Phycisphaerales bacterium]
GVLEDDCPSCTENNHCADGDACTVDTCDVATGVCSNTPKAVAATECCDNVPVNLAADVGGLGAVVSNVDGNDCTFDECTPATGCAVGAQCGVPSNPPMPAGDPCDDGIECDTVDDQCDGAGNCAGTSILAVPCPGGDPDCEAKHPAASCNPVTGFCRCVPPSLNFDVHPSDKVPNNACHDAGDKITVDVFFKDTPEVVYGGQFVVLYDPSCLQFRSINPGGDPYTFEIHEIVDEANGMIFYAVGVDPMGGVGVMGTGILAQISFAKLGACTECILCFGGENPLNTYLVNNIGQMVADVEPKCSDTIMANDEPWLECPGDAKVNVDCDKNTAMVFWDAPTFGSSCYPDADLVCWGQHESGLDMTALAMGGGGEHPLGVTRYHCDVTTTVCGHSVGCDWTVTVNHVTTLDVEIQLSPIIAGDLLRCIKFELYSDCVQSPLVVEKDIFFGGLFDHIGHFTDVIKIPGAGQWRCITARDQLHTLRSCAWLECIDGVYYAVFKGDPFFGGNWLVGGNLDGFKKDIPTASHDVIDIFDFGTFVVQWAVRADPNTICGTPGPNADINGDGIVDALDFTFVMMNFLDHSKDCCCGPAAGTIVGRTEVSVRELREMGLGELAVGDLNRDGLLNMDDVQAFQAGDQQPRKGSRDRAGMSR